MSDRIEAIETTATILLGAVLFAFTLLAFFMR